MAVSLPLDDGTLDSLAARLGSRFHLHQFRTAPTGAAIVLCPPCSPGALNRLRKEFPVAVVVVVEARGGAAVAGPVGRVFEAGADSYLPNPSLRSLLSALDRAA